MRTYEFRFEFAGTLHTVVIVSRSFFHAIADMLVLWRDVEITSVREI